MQNPEALCVLPANNEERSSRIDGIFKRGMHLAQQAYTSKSSLEDYGGKMMDRSLVGTHINYAHGLLKLGDADSTQIACAIVSDIIDMQETHQQHPHRGNWPRWVGDDEITDLFSAGLSHYSSHMDSNSLLLY